MIPFDPESLRNASAALMRFGYTSREAAFLAFVALHSGYFLRPPNTATLSARKSEAPPPH